MSRRGIRIAVLFSAALALPATTNAVSPEWASRWSEDLDVLERQLPETHANLFHSLDPDRWTAMIADLRARIPELTHHEIVVELARIVAAVGDGHTRVTLPLAENVEFFQGHSSTPDPLVPDLVFHQYPIRFFDFSDGLFVEKVEERHAAAAGCRVLRIGNVPVEEAMARVEPLVQRDNELQVRHHLPTLLVLAEVLQAVRITDDAKHLPLALESPEGRRLSITLDVAAGDQDIPWIDARTNATNEFPLRLERLQEHFWFEPLPDYRAVYVQYNTVYDSADETVTAFSERLFAFVREHDVQRLILDLRWNRGGDNSNNQPLLHGLIGCRELREPGQLFVIVGRGTFSAAMMFAVDLERNTNAIFVGEPTGSSPNHYGDSRKLQLPNSGVTIRVSSLYWQYSDPRDTRPFIEPLVSAPLSSADYRTNHDPALEAILLPAADDPSGAWRGWLRVFRGRRDLGLTLERTTDGWSGTLDIPRLGLEAVPLANVAYDPPRLRFDLVHPEGTVAFTCTEQSGRIVGTAAEEGNVYPFALTR